MSGAPVALNARTRPANRPSSAAGKIWRSRSSSLCCGRSRGFHLSNPVALPVPSLSTVSKTPRRGCRHVESSLALLHVALSGSGLRPRFLVPLITDGRCRPTGRGLWPERL